MDDRVETDFEKALLVRVDRLEARARARDSEADAKTDADASGDQDDGDDDDDGDGEQQPKKPLLRRPVFWIVIVLVIVGIAAGVAYWWTRVRPFASTDDAFIGADIVNIVPQVTGKIVTVPVGANTRVAAGDLLARIDSAEYRAQLDTAKAAVSRARAGVLQAEAGITEAKAMVAEAEAQSAALDSNAQNAADTLRRDQEIFDAGNNAIPEKTVVDARAAAQAAKAQAQAGQRAVETARTGVTSAEAEATAAKAQVASAQADLESARITFGYGDLVAPIAGQVVQKTINTGSYVQPGMAIMAIVPDDLYVTANYKETQLGSVRPGQSVDIHVDAFPNVTFTGRVISIQHGAGQAFQLLPPQNATGNYVKVVQRVPVRISIENADRDRYPLGPGMSVVPSIRIDSVPDDRPKDN